MAKTSGRLLKLSVSTTLVLIFNLQVCPTNGARILGLFTLPSKSQYLLGSALLKGLAAKGHEVTIISNTCSDSVNNPKNYTEICEPEILRIKKTANFPLPNETSFFGFHKLFMTFANRIPRVVLDNEDVQKLIKSDAKFDVTIHALMHNEALLGLSHKLNSTVIFFSPQGTNPFISYYAWNPAPYSYVPFLLTPYTDEMTFYQRLMNTLVSIYHDLCMRFYIYPTQSGILKEYFPGVPNLNQLLENVDIFFLNSHFSTQTPRPLLHNLIEIGGFHMDNLQDLPRDLQNFLDNSSNGVVYFSLGTNFNAAKALSPKEKQEILAAIGKLKYDVLWKYDDDIKDLPKNTKISKWVPQREVLAHPKVKAFITHSGMGSTVEAIYMGVPMVCVPLMGDQVTNAKESAAKGYGIYLPFSKITKDTLYEAVLEVIENPLYRSAVQLRSELYRNQPIKPIDLADFWVKHVIRHKGAKHLKGRATKIPWYQYFLLDVIVCISIFFLIISFVIYFLFKKAVGVISALLNVKKNNKCDKKKVN